MLEHQETPALRASPPGEEPRPAEANAGADWDVISQASWESFPASDPPARIYRGRNEYPPAARRRSQMEREMNVEIRGEEIVVDAQLLGDLLDIPPAEVPALMRARSITSMCERGVDAHDGQYRLSFFYQNRRARLSVDRDGRILRQSSIDFGERPLPASMHRPGD
jgi:hypothetical protein